MTISSHTVGISLPSFCRTRHSTDFGSSTLVSGSDGVGSRLPSYRQASAFAGVA